MANFKNCSSFNIYDDYYTPKSVWERITHLVPKDKVIWEACMLNATNSTSIDIWKELGYECVGNKEWDILSCPIPECDMIITNPPFETKLKIKILTRLLEIDKPFMIIMSGLNIFSKYFHEIMDLDNIQIIIPKRKLHFIKDGKKEMKDPSFYSVFVAYKMNLSNKDLYC